VEMLRPLAEGTLKGVKQSERAEALTGPISRGDVETIRRHLRALEKHPAARKIYQLLGAEALRLARRHRDFPGTPVSLASRRAKIAPRNLRSTHIDSSWERIEKILAAKGVRTSDVEKAIKDVRRRT